MTHRLASAALAAGILGLGLCIASCRTPGASGAGVDFDPAASSRAREVRRIESELERRNVRDPARWDNLGGLASGADADVARRAFDRAETLMWADSSPRNASKLSPPFAGRWVVTQGNRGDYSHDRLADRFAWDFQCVDEEGRSSPRDRGGPSAFYGFGAPILAPADGVVEVAEDGVPDNVDGLRNYGRPGGNRVVLRHATAEMSHFCHLQRGSVTVKVGQAVRRGDVIGRCGCSGNAVEPHLHYVLRSGVTSESLSIPSRFDFTTIVREGRPASDGIPREGDIVAPTR
jgi:hypothetical protein